jgi:hypothetical protein
VSFVVNAKFGAGNRLTSRGVQKTAGVEPTRTDSDLVERLGEDPFFQGTKGAADLESKRRARNFGESPFVDAGLLCLSGPVSVDGGEKSVIDLLLVGMEKLDADRTTSRKEDVQGSLTGRNRIDFQSRPLGSYDPKSVDSFGELLEAEESRSIRGGGVSAWPAFDASVREGGSIGPGDSPGEDAECMFRRRDFFLGSIARGSVESGSLL